MTPYMFMKGTKKRQGKNESDEDFLCSLTHLNLKNRGITEIEGLEACPRLQVLYLYDNMISRIANLDVISKRLTHLYLQNNRITSMQGLECLPNLTKLYLDDNEIPRVEALHCCHQLEELHLANQKLPRGAALTFDPASMDAIGSSLAILNLANNNIHDAEPLCYLQRLYALDMTGNALEFVEQMPFLHCCPYLNKLDIAGCPVSKAPKARDEIIVCTDHLESLDGKEISEKERMFLRTMRSRRPRSRATAPGARAASAAGRSRFPEVHSQPSGFVARGRRGSVA